MNKYKSFLHSFRHRNKKLFFDTDLRVGANEFDLIYNRIHKEFEKSKVYFVTGSGRSGTTSCARILGTASNSRIFHELEPRFTTEVLQYRLGNLIDPRPTIWNRRIELIREVIQSGSIYGEKDQQTFCWLPFYRELFNPRFVFVKKDGRDAIRSNMDYHNLISATMYREAIDKTKPTAQAMQALGSLPVDEDLTEQARPRPLPNDSAYGEWPMMSRLEMFAWYWSHTTRVIQRDLYRMEDWRWKEIDYTDGPSMEDIMGIFDFLELDGFDEEKVTSLLDVRVGSIEQMSNKEYVRFPSWEDWDDITTKSFNRYAGSAMVELGYSDITKLPKAVPLGVFQEFEYVPSQTPQPQGVLQKLNIQLNAHFKSQSRVLQIGPEGLDVPLDNLTIWKGGKLGSLPQGEFDIVIALGVVDKVPELDEFLIQLAKRTAGMLILTSSRGYQLELIDHVYNHNPSLKTNIHGWSISKTRSLMSMELGFENVISGGIENGDPCCPKIAFVVGFKNGE